MNATTTLAAQPTTTNSTLPEVSETPSGIPARKPSLLGSIVAHAAFQEHLEFDTPEFSTAYLHKA